MMPDKVHFDPQALGTPMVVGADGFASKRGERSCIRCKTDFLCNCPVGKLYEKRYGVIIRMRGNVLRIELDDGRRIYVDKLWGCGGGLSPRIIVGARLKLYQRDWKIHYRLVGQ